MRTLGLAEVIFAQLITHRFFAQRTSGREALGILLILAGVALALNGGGRGVPSIPLAFAAR